MEYIKLFAIILLSVIGFFVWSAFWINYFVDVKGWDVNVKGILIMFLPLILGSIIILLT